MSRYKSQAHAPRYNHNGITVSYVATLLSGSIAETNHPVFTGFQIK
ncbi:hypothetical protein KA405_00895 [Patescibacteria group bacterium]|nr:hypothetical protein [Patescibacteria group bacterium]